MAREHSRKSTLQLIAPPALVDAVKAAADREMTSISEYVRRSLIDRLRSDGIDLASSDKKSSAIDQFGAPA